MSDDLQSKLRQLYPSAHEGAEYANVLADLLFWCMVKRVSPLRFATPGIRQAGRWIEDEDLRGWSLVTGIEEWDAQMGEDVEIEEPSGAKMQGCVRFEKAVEMIFGGPVTDERCIDLFEKLYHSLGNLDALVEAMKAADRHMMQVMADGRPGPIYPDEWYSVSELTDAFGEDHAHRAFRECGVDPTTDGASLAGSQVIEWMEKNSDDGDLE